jgi:hypothetical protein
MNAYEYAVGDPINITDPSGQFGIWDLTGAIVATVAGIALGALTFGTGTFAGLGLAGTILLGAAIGAVSGALGNVAQTLVDGTPFDYKQLLLETALGAAFSVVGEGVSAGIAKGIRSFKAWKAARRARLDARAAPERYAFDDAVSASSSSSRTTLRSLNSDKVVIDPAYGFPAVAFADAVEPAALGRVVAAQASDVVFTAESAISRGSLAARPNSVNIVQAADNMQGIRMLPDISDAGSVVGGGSGRGTVLSARNSLDEIRPGTLDDAFTVQADAVLLARQQQAESALQDSWKLFMDKTQGANRWQPGEPIPFGAIPQPTGTVNSTKIVFSDALVNGKQVIAVEWPAESLAYYQQYWKGLSDRNVYIVANSDKTGQRYWSESVFGPAIPVG